MERSDGATGPAYAGTKARFLHKTYRLSELAQGETCPPQVNPHGHFHRRSVLLLQRNQQQSAGGPEAVVHIEHCYRKMGSGDHDT